MGKNSGIRLDNPAEFLRRLTVYKENVDVAVENTLDAARKVALRELARVVKTAPNLVKEKGRHESGDLQEYAETKGARVFVTRGGNTSLEIGYGKDAPFHVKYQEPGTNPVGRRGIIPMYSVAIATSKAHAAMFTQLGRWMYAAGDQAEAGKLMKRANTAAVGAETATAGRMAALSSQRKSAARRRAKSQGRARRR